MPAEPAPVSAVFDTSSLVFLARLDYLPLLPRLYKVNITPVVAQELRAKPGEAGSDIPELTWVRVRQPEANALEQVQGELAAEPGEITSIALALELDHWVVLDDKPARAYATRLGLKLVGTLGILLRIHQLGLNARRFEEDIAILEGAGMHLSQSVKQTVLDAFLEGES